MKIRSMKKSDLNVLSKIYVEVYRVFDVGEKWTQKSAYNLLNFWFNRQPDLCFVAEYKNKIVGAFVTYIKPWSDGNHLIAEEIFVDPLYQKHGIGTELTKKIFQKAIIDYNAKIVEGITFSKFKHPLSWYKSLGFKEVKEWVVISGDIKKALKILQDKQPKFPLKPWD